MTSARHSIRPASVCKPSHAPALKPKCQCFGHDDLDSALRDQLGHGRAIELPIRLEARTLDRGALAAVEHAPVDRGPVGRARHQAVEDVELADQMTFADTADRRIARHLADVLGPEGDKSDARATARRGGGSLASGMAGTNDQDVEHAEALSGFGRIRKSSQTTCFT